VFSQDDQFHRRIQDYQSDAKLKASIELQKSELADLKDSVNLALSEQTKYISFLTLLTGMVIGCVTLVFAAGVVFTYKENRFLVGRVKEELHQCQNLKSEFSVWFKEQDALIKRTFAAELKDYQRETENLNYFNYLKTLLDEPPIELSAVYTHLTPLIVDPKLIYRPLFDRILQLNLNADINAKAQEGIDNIKKLPKA
jgi:hypothetical protein